MGRHNGERATYTYTAEIRQAERPDGPVYVPLCAPLVFPYLEIRDYLADNPHIKTVYEKFKGAFTNKQEFRLLYPASARGPALKAQFSALAEWLKQDPLVQQRKIIFVDFFQQQLINLESFLKFMQLAVRGNQLEDIPGICERFYTQNNKKFSASVEHILRGTPGLEDETIYPWQDVVDGNHSGDNSITKDKYDGALETLITTYSKTPTLMPKELQDAVRASIQDTYRRYYDIYHDLQLKELANVLKLEKPDDLKTLSLQDCSRDPVLKICLENAIRYLVTELVLFGVRMQGPVVYPFGDDRGKLFLAAIVPTVKEFLGAGYLGLKPGDIENTVSPWIPCGERVTGDVVPYRAVTMLIQKQEISPVLRPSSPSGLFLTPSGAQPKELHRRHDSQSSNDSTGSTDPLIQAKIDMLVAERAAATSRAALYEAKKRQIEEQITCNRIFLSLVSACRRVGVPRRIDGIYAWITRTRGIPGVDLHSPNGSKASLLQASILNGDRQAGNPQESPQQRTESRVQMAASSSQYESSVSHQAAAGSEINRVVLYPKSSNTPSDDGDGLSSESGSSSSRSASPLLKTEKSGAGRENDQSVPLENSATVARPRLTQPNRP